MMMTETSSLPVIDVLLVEDDQGDVLMTREAFAQHRIHSELHVAIAYKNRALTARADVTLMRPLVGRDAGQLTAELTLPLALTLGMLQSRPAALAQELQAHTPLAATDVFYGSSMLFLALIPLVWLARPAKGGAGSDAAAGAH